MPKNSAAIVDILTNAGAIVIGKTNLDQFATGLVGTRSPYGKPCCAFSDKHISGGSSSGSASVCARGIVPFSLGTDTAGSGRVPAGLNNIIGLKPTLGAFSCQGVIPACKTLDCVSVFSLNLKDAQLVFSLAAKYDQSYGYSRSFPSNALTTFGRRPVFAVPEEPLFFGEQQNAIKFQEAIKKFRDNTGVEIVPVDFSVLYKLANLLYEGPWVAERYSAIRDFITNKPEELDPTVYKVVKKAENFTAADFFDYEYQRKDILKEIEKHFDQFDGLIVPTSPLNPTFEDIEAEPILVNSRQGTYTNFVNLADLSALSIPNGFRDDGLPVGVTLVSKKFNDYALLDLAQRYLTTNYAERTLGSTSVKVGHGDSLRVEIIDKVAVPTIQLAVVGGHLSGMALNWQLQKVDARLLEKTSTSPNYRLYALPNTEPPKPGLRRVCRNGSSVAVEVWDVPADKFGTFISMVPHPLGIGSVELQSGKWVKGFICEEMGYSEAVDITGYGGWRNYISDTSKSSPFQTVLVANRGEIAVRLISSLKKLNIKSVAVFSEPDRYAQHVLDADVAVDLKGTTASETYLSIRKIIKAARDTCAQAIIPGYGFLSENADFAEACEQEGIVFVGPSSDSIRALGLKHSAREIAEKAGVPLVPGSGLIETLDEALETANKLGYPLMIKSTAGGGGIGLEKVVNDEELKFAFENVKRQGQAFFNDSGVFLERFVENARHVEVQVFGDGMGDAISLGERDCSLQRRNQKIIEETPAPNFPEATRQRIRLAAEGLVRTMRYKNAGTVEFIYDERRDEFYFLEVNARLQVEHPITEMVTGLDLVEWMLYIAANRAPDFSRPIIPQGAAMEARLYAENPVKDFLPSPGELNEVIFPNDGMTRIDTWIEKGTKISAEYDPTLAKIIVYGQDRNEALQKLSRALDQTRIGGVVTNIDYLRSIVKSEMFVNAKVGTKVLDSFKYYPYAIEITSPGSYTTIQDYPGRTGLWHIGVPPSGPMDDFSFRTANRIVGNDVKAPAIECTLVGPSIVFHHDSVIAITGGESPVTLDDEPVSLWKPITVKAGQRLVVGKLTSGCRSYIAIRAGIDVGEYLGSRSTFALGNLGGHNGRTLKIGDVLFLGQPELTTCTIPSPISEPKAASSSIIPQLNSNTWFVGVTSGPHGSPDFFTAKGIEEFFACEWKVHYNSNRFGVRLCGGPKPDWARPDGGEGGLHPSNTHDYVYSIGAINFTGDEPVILTCDGPSLGGFVCVAVVVESEMWKIGQAKPGDRIKFVPVSFDSARELKDKQSLAIDRLDGSLPDVLQYMDEYKSPVLYKSDDENNKVNYRQAGDRYILVEFGNNIMDLNVSYKVHKFKEAVSKLIPAVIEMSPGVRSLLIEYNTTLTSQNKLVEELKSVLPDATKDWTMPSRIIRLPLAFEEFRILAAVERYKDTIRSNAPWLPNNVDFLAELNGFKDRTQVRDVLYQARYLVLGLGDVFLGAPCAVPLDPRHRLAGTKYNPSRTYTPNGGVGIGGMYMCIYAMDSPGGYQLVGRTIPIWDKLTLNGGKNPWLLSPFDQIEFYPVSEEVLNVYEEQVKTGRYKLDIVDSVFDYKNYSKWLDANKESIAEHEAKKNSKDIVEMLKLIQESSSLSSSSAVEDSSADDDEFSENAKKVYAEVVTGRFWKNLVNAGDAVTKGQGILVLEAMKTEMVINAPVSGKVVKIYHSKGDMVETGDLVAVIEP